MPEIIPALDRTAAARGVKALIVGPVGVGKTSLLRTIDPTSTLFVDIEAGDLAVQDIAVDTARPRTWPECRDLAVALAGADPAVPAGACYSAEHLDAVSTRLSYPTVFVDSITAASRLCLTWALQQPEAFTDRGRKDVRGAYGLLARELLGWLLHLQQARSVNVVLVAVLEPVKDDFGHVEHRAQLEGQKTVRELPAIVDEIISYQWVDFGDGVPVRSFVCTAPNKWNYPAKDRSGRLEQFEQPDLGKLFLKLSATASGDVVEFKPRTPSEREATS